MTENGHMEKKKEFLSLALLNSILSALSGESSLISHST